MSTRKKQANEAALAALNAIGGPAMVERVAKEFGADLVSGVIGAIERSVQWKKYSPCAAAAYHQRMFESFPKWRWIPRGHHQRLTRKWKAMCSVEDLRKCGLDDDKCR